MAVVSHCSFSLRFPNGIKFEQIFICLFAICVSSLVTCLFFHKVASCLNGLRSSFCVLDNSPLSNVLTNFFSQFTVHLLIPLIMYFVEVWFLFFVFEENVCVCVCVCVCKYIFAAGKKYGHFHLHDCQSQFTALVSGN